MSMQIVFEQILIIFGYVIVGYDGWKEKSDHKRAAALSFKICFITHSSVYSAVSKQHGGKWTRYSKCCHCCGASFFLYGTYISWVYAICKNKTGAGKKAVQPTRHFAHILIAPLLECLYVLR